MHAFRFLHAADLHLDSRFAGLMHLPAPVRSYLRESTFAAFGRLICLAVEEEVDFVVISGDIYDMTEVSLQGQLRFHEGLKQLGEHGIGVFMIHGNHDPLDGPRLQARVPEHVTVFGGDAPGLAAAYRRRDGKEVAVISGISYPTAKVTENTALRFQRKRGSELFHIALLHGNVDGDLLHETYSPCSRRDLIGQGFDYWALGHIHKRRVLHEKPYIIYPGNIQGRSVKETGAKGCYIVDVQENGEAVLHFHELNVVRWDVRELPIEGLEHEADWITAVEQSIEEIREEHPGIMSVVRYRLTGRGGLHRLLTERGAVSDLLAELQRRETLRAERGAFQGMVWPEGFAVESGLAVDKEHLLQEDSFLGEMLRLAGKGVDSPEELEAITGTALAPLMENRELRKMMSAASTADKQRWLRDAAELGIMLLSGFETAEERTREAEDQPDRGRQGED